jgi:hypothetical protein
MWLEKQVFACVQWLSRFFWCWYKKELKFKKVAFGVQTFSKISS